MSLSVFFPAAHPASERERQRAVDASGVLRAPPDPTLHRVTASAAKLFDAPMAALSIVDRDRTWFAARVGLKLPETSRSASFCAHAILNPDQPLLILDAAADERFAGNPFVQGEPWLRFYAGAAVRSPEGHALGTLCVLDVEPREAPLPLVALARLADKAAEAIAEIGRNMETLG